MQSFKNPSFDEYGKEKDALVVIPTYNEAGSIEPLIQAIFSLPLSLSVLVVDDNSRDGTIQKVECLQKKYPFLYILKRPRKMGLASAYVAGFTYAFDHHYEVVFQMDADLSHSPQYLPGMFKSLKTCDAVIGSRYVPGGGSQGWPRSRFLLSKYANLFSRTLLHLPLHDVTSGLRCIRIQALRAVNFGGIRSQGYMFQIETAYLLMRNGFTVREYPIIFKQRERGKSKMSFYIIFEAFMRVLFLSVRSCFGARVCRIHRSR